MTTYAVNFLNCTATANCQLQAKLEPWTSRGESHGPSTHQRTLINRSLPRSAVLSSPSRLFSIFLPLLAWLRSFNLCTFILSGVCSIFQLAACSQHTSHCAAVISLIASQHHSISPASDASADQTRSKVLTAAVSPWAQIKDQPPRPSPIAPFACSPFNFMHCTSLAILGFLSAESWLSINHLAL